MKKLTLIVLAVICCSTYSCKKKAEEVLNTASPMANIDFREKYTGVYKVHVVGFDDPYSTSYEDSFDCKMAITYNPKDSMQRYYQGIPFPPNQILPRIDVYYFANGKNDKLFRKFGVDTNGKWYNEYDGMTTTYGGFYGNNIFNVNIKTQTSHTGGEAMLTGSKIQ